MCSCCDSWHGKGRTTNTDEIEKYQIVVTTYDTPVKNTNGEGSPLTRVNFDRIFFDECNQLGGAAGSPSGISARGNFWATKVNAHVRWLLTGTPLARDPLNIQSFVRILRMEEQFGTFRVASRGVPTMF